MFETPVVPTRFRLRALLAAHEPPMSQSELARRSEVSLVTEQHEERLRGRLAGLVAAEG